jgi:hypothetical protein
MPPQFPHIKTIEKTQAAARPACYSEHDEKEAIMAVLNSAIELNTIWLDTAIDCWTATFFPALYFAKYL